MIFKNNVLYNIIKSITIPFLLKKQLIFPLFMQVISIFSFTEMLVIPLITG